MSHDANNASVSARIRACFAELDGSSENARHASLTMIISAACRSSNETSGFAFSLGRRTRRRKRAASIAAHQIERIRVKPFASIHFAALLPIHATPPMETPNETKRPRGEGSGITKGKFSGARAPNGEWDEVRRLLMNDSKLAHHEVEGLALRFRTTPGAALTALDGVDSPQSLAELGLMNSSMDLKAVNFRVARIQRGADRRARLQHYLANFAWACEFCVPRIVLDEVSVLEWRVAEAGNPYVLMEHFIQAEMFPRAEEAQRALSLCTNFAASFLSEKQLADPDVCRIMEIGAVYHFVLYWLMRHGGVDRMRVESVKDGMRRALTEIELTWSWEIDEFDPSIGLRDQEEGLARSITESYAESARRKKGLKLHEWTADRRLMNRIAFVGHPEAEHAFEMEEDEAAKAQMLEFDPVTGAAPQYSPKEYVCLRETLVAERELPDLLDSIKRGVIAERLTDEALAPIRERTKKTTKSSAFGLSLDSSSSSSSEDDPNPDQSN